VGAWEGRGRGDEVCACKGAVPIVSEERIRQNVVVEGVVRARPIVVGLGLSAVVEVEEGGEGVPVIEPEGLRSIVSPSISSRSMRSSGFLMSSIEDAVECRGESWTEPSCERSIVSSSTSSRSRINFTFPSSPTKPIESRAEPSEPEDDESRRA
jgi:hypothetical protein